MCVKESDGSASIMVVLTNVAMDAREFNLNRDELCPGENLWYFVGRDPDGHRVGGAATIELLGEMEDVTQGSKDQNKRS